MEQAKRWQKDDNCRSQSEFIEKAIEFYCGYVSSEKNKNYLSNIVVSTLKSIVRESDNRTGRLLFKIAVELAMTMNVLASMEEIDEIDLARLRGNCVEEVKRINGMAVLRRRSGVADGIDEFLFWLDIGKALW